ncbi:MAG: hemerythrin domain-containing protein [Thaumarchaeota archaeon]|nr:hemerythrin domain-containing protein [Nitrososphaerota archaeon]
MIARLEKEHRYFRTEIDRSTNLLENNRDVAIDVLNNLSSKIIQHAVEEEVRLVRIIMEKAKAESEQSIHVMQEHNYVVDFIKHKLPELYKLQFSDARNEIAKFTSALKEHFVEEEKIVFPLALRLAS